MDEKMRISEQKSSERINPVDSWTVTHHRVKYTGNNGISEESARRDVERQLYQVFIKYESD